MEKKKKLIIEIILFIILLIGITVIYNNVINNKSDIQENIKEEEKVEIMEIKNAEQFEKEVINEKGTVLIDFYATWCMPCRTMSPIIKEIAKEHTEIKVVKVDIDNNEELAIKYNVMSIPTMIVMKNGEVAKTFVGVTSKENIIKEL